MRTLLLVASLASALAVTACSSKSSEQKPAVTTDASSLLIDRNWIDRMPESPTDRLHVYRFVPSMGGGVYQDRTLFKGTFELFMFKVKGDMLEMSLPANNQNIVSQFKIEPVDGPAPFDLKLTIWSDPRGPQHYYGIRSETDRDGRLLEQSLTARRATMQPAGK